MLRWGRRPRSESDILTGNLVELMEPAGDLTERIWAT